MRIALAQVDCVLGDVEANLATAEKCVADAAARGAELVVFPELSLHGYAVAGLAEDRSVPSTDPRLAELSRHGPDVVVGFHEAGTVRRHNTASYFAHGELRHLHRKLYLPSYLSWQERNHASPGQAMRAFDTEHGRMAILICNDAWQPPLPWLAAQDGAEVLLIPTNSAHGLAPDLLDTIEYWSDLLRFIARMQQCWVIFVNRVGEESGTRFWGGSRVIDPSGTMIADAPLWEPALLTVDLQPGTARRRRHQVPLIAEARLGLIAREVQRLVESEGDL